ncbi:MAG: hypothetical protein KatS3mg096_831 [Candidatus Parcubacteria bacterium]|nr:MAG: hypothetical protein KatS3mg096_831 [Candidatus Parcubacteria bacterium]
MPKKLSLKFKWSNVFNKIIKVSALIWFLTIIGFVILTFYVAGIRKETFDKAPDIYGYLAIGLIGFGLISFSMATLFLAIKLISQNFQKKQNIFIFLLKLFFALLIFPLYLFIYVINPLKLIKNLKSLNFSFLKHFSFKNFFKKLAILLFILFIYLPVWFIGYFVIFYSTLEVLGYNPIPLPISGTGSMYPTFPKGQGKDPKELGKQIVAQAGMIRYPNGVVIFGKRFLNYELQRGDIVVVYNNKIREISEKIHEKPSGWVKRLIALPGDSIELRGGIVYLNNQPLKEPYTAKAHSTFGQGFLSECKKVVVPQNHIFVMGDNRKGSSDSREIGFIEISAVKYVLPIKDQKGDLIKHWRDTTKDFDESSKIRLDKEKYLQLLNEKRKEFKVKPLKYQKKLQLSAQKRGEIILKYNDFSFEATKSGYTMEKAMREVNYFNIVWGEAPTQGYFEAEELIENQFQFPETKEFLLNKDYQEIGIAEVEGEINGCPTQVIVQHFAGYVPPNYSKEVIESWRLLLNRLKEIQPGWQSVKDYKEFYEKNKTDVDRINEIISIRINNISAIVSRMEKNQWLTKEEEAMIKNDEVLSKEQEEIATRLNSQ